MLSFINLVVTAPNGEGKAMSIRHSLYHNLNDNLSLKLEVEYKVKFRIEMVL